MDSEITRPTLPTISHVPTPPPVRPSVEAAPEPIAESILQPTIEAAIEAALAGPAAPPVPDDAVGHWLADHGLVELRRGEPARAADALLHRVAHQAMLWPDVDMLLRCLRSQLNRDVPRNPRVPLSDDLAGRQAALQAALELASVGIVADPKITDRYLTVRLTRGDSTRRRVLRFLDGRWLEAGVLAVAKAVLPGGPTTQIISNLEVSDEDGRKYELDLVVVGPTYVTVVECKAGWQPEAQVPRFRDVCDATGVTGAHAVYVAPHMTVEAAEQCGTFHDVTVLGSTQLGDHLLHLHAEGAEEPPAIAC